MWWPATSRYLATITLTLGVGLAAISGAFSPAGAQGRTPATQVTAISLTELGATTRVAVDVSQRAEYRVFFLNEPMRAVIDLPPIAWTIPGTMPSPRGLVASYRYGQFDPQTSRLVLDLAGPARVRQSRYELPQGGRHRLVVEFERISQAEFEQQIQPWMHSVTKTARKIGRAHV